MCHTASQQHLMGDPVRVSMPSSGYVYATQYWEQQSSSSFSLLSLQCWAGSLNYKMSVVEPFYYAGWPQIFSYHQKSTAPRFSDLFDLATWNNVSEREYDAGLVPWSHFVNNALGDLITVQIIYWWVVSADAHGRDRHERISSGCKWNLEDQDPFFHSYRIVRRACINFSYGDILTMEEFNGLVFGNYSQQNISVIFQEWRGFSTNPFRVPIAHGCGDEIVLMSKAVAPSARMLALASDYKEQYLHNAEYIAIMVRMEKAVEMHPIQHIRAFLERVWNASNKLQHEHNISNMFVSMDIGRFGSSTLVDKSLISLGVSFFEEVTGKEVSISVWENSFQAIAKTADPAIIARLQSTIVSQSRCAVIAGGGTFQLHTIMMYHAAHQRERSCLEEIK